MVGDGRYAAASVLTLTRMRLCDRPRDVRGDDQVRALAPELLALQGAARCVPHQNRRRAQTRLFLIDFFPRAVDEVNPGPNVKTDDDIRGKPSRQPRVLSRLDTDIDPPPPAASQPGSRNTCPPHSVSTPTPALSSHIHAPLTRPLRNCFSSLPPRRPDTAGTASMLPREKGGVVDPQLRVYGTANLRVVDLSVVPLLFAAHTQCTSFLPACAAVVECPLTMCVLRVRACA